MKHLQVMIATLAIHIVCISPLAVGAEQYPASGSAAAQGSAAQTPETARPYFGLIAYDTLIPIMKQMSLNEPLPAQKLIEKVNKVSGRAPLATLLIDATIIKCAVGKGEPV